MANNKITIETGRQNKSGSPNILKDDLLNPPVTPAEPEQQSSQELPDDKVWGNDYLLDKSLDKEYLEEKRRYVRVRYMQYVKCHTVGESLDAAPLELNNPITLIISDISMSGIGVVCGQEFKIGSVLDLDICLDNLNYSVKCEVIYCIQMEENFRIGLKIVKKNKDFIKHLKILVARISLRAQYGESQSKET